MTLLAGILARCGSPSPKRRDELSKLISRAEAGEDVVLTRHGKETVRLVPVQRRPDAEARRALIAAMQAAAAGKRRAGTSAARSQDFLYDDDGLPK